LQDVIVIDKKNVRHTFVDAGANADFLRNIFPSWESETFDVFDQVKNTHGIAIDLGAWIGTTAIWLSKNFYHVIAVEGDRESLIDLKKNLEASKCFNVTLCGQPVTGTQREVIFGPRGNRMNESISCVKVSSTSEKDYIIESLTVRQLIKAYISENPQINSHPIAFIKCDIEGGEEEILEELLEFAYKNQSKAYISFHLDWWRSKKIVEFENLFKLFTIAVPLGTACDHLKNNPFGSLLFEPLPTGP
jgi:FkbM family methyltransferase